MEGRKHLAGGGKTRLWLLKGSEEESLSLETRGECDL